MNRSGLVLAAACRPVPKDYDDTDCRQEKKEKVQGRAHRIRESRLSKIPLRAGNEAVGHAAKYAVIVRLVAEVRRDPRGKLQLRIIMRERHASQEHYRHIRSDNQKRNLEPSPNCQIHWSTTTQNATRWQAVSTTQIG